MPLPNFPDSPTVGQEFSVGSVTYRCTATSPKPVWSIAIDKADSTLRAQLADAESEVIVAGIAAKRLSKIVDGIKNLIVLPNHVQTVRGYYTGSNVGGGDFYYDPSRSKTEHNGGTVIAPEALNAWDGSSANLNVVLNWSGTGNGCFVRYQNTFEVETFGGLSAPFLCTESMQKLLDTYGKFIGVPFKEYVIRKVNINRPVMLDLNRCVIRGDVFTTSGFSADNIKGIYIKNGTLIHQKTVGVYVQAFTFWNCEDVILEDLLLDGFSQFSIQIAHSLNRTFSNFTLKRVKVHNAGNFLNDPSAVANCLEFFNRNSESYRTDTTIEDCEFFLIDGAKANIAKFGICTNTVIKRTKFKSIRRTGVGSSGLQSGATGNPYNHINKVILEDVIIECVDTQDGYYAFDGVGTNIFIRTHITGNGGSIYNPPKGEGAYNWSFFESSVAQNFLYDRTTNYIDKLELVKSKIPTIKLEKSATDPLTDECIVKSLILEDSEVSLINPNCTIENIIIKGNNSKVASLIFGATEQMKINKVQICNSARVDDLYYADPKGYINYINAENAVISKITLRTNNLKNLLIKGCTLLVRDGFEWYLNGSDSCNVLNNNIFSDPENSPTAITNLLQFYDESVLNNNLFINIDREYYVTASDCIVHSINNVFLKTYNNYNLYATTGTGEVKNFNCMFNGTMMPFSFRSINQSISSTPISHGQLALVSGEWYMSVGTVSATDWKKIT